MARKNILMRAFCKLARKFRSLEERYLIRLLPVSLSRLGAVPLWLLDITVLVVKLCTTCSMSLVRIILPPLPKSLHGETVLVTGAGQGIGRELALQLAELGATVVCWDSNASSNDTTLRYIAANDGEGLAYTVDVGSREQVMTTAASMKKKQTEVSMVVSNAAVMTAGPLCHLQPDAIVRSIEINLLAHFWILQAFLPQMIERRHGHIVAINSTLGLVPASDLAPYCAAKYGLRGLMESLSEELRLDTWTKNIKTTSVYLATVSTGLYPVPTHRFTSCYSEIDAKEAAKSIIQGIRKNKKTLSIPVYMEQLINFNNLIPYRIRIIFTDFFNFAHRGWFCFC